MYYRLYIFALPVNKKGKPKVFGSHSESPKVREAYHSFLKIYKNDILAKNKKWVFESHYAESKNRHLVYEFFDTSQGGYHPQMELVVNNL